MITSSTFGSRIQEYVADMGILQKDLGGILGLSAKTISAYARDNRTPTHAGLVTISRRTGLSLDWLSGESDSPKWGAEIHDLRVWLRARIPDLQAEDVTDRCRGVVRLLQAKSPLCKQDWFMGGVLAVDKDEFETFKNGAGRVKKKGLGRLADLTGVSELWLMLGDPKYLTGIQLSEDQARSMWRVVERLIDAGVTPAEIEDNAGEIEMLVRQLRKIHS